MSLYPSLEDMKVDQMAQAQAHQMHAQQQAIGYAPAAPAPGHAAPASVTSSLYPSLSDYMGIDVSEEAVRRHVPDYSGAIVPSGGAAIVPQTSSGAIAPVSGSNNLGIQRAEIKGGVREVILCKDNDGKLGLRVRAVNKGIFVAFVHSNSPAALGGLRFGDQILQIDEENMAGFDTDKAMKRLKNASPQRIVFAIRDRPFERTIILQKDSSGHVGFVFKDSKITKIAKDTSAARNGLLTEHHMVEVNGQNVVGLKDSEIKKILEGHDRTITLTIIPSFICEHIMKCMASSLVKKNMDHSIPEV